MGTFKYKDAVTIILVIIASLLCAINIQTFVNAGNLFPGGFTGVTVFIQRLALDQLGIELPFFLINFTLNAFPAYIGYKTLGKKFTFYSCLMIVLIGIFVEFIPVINITEDILLITIFGGILQGVAMGIALQGNASGGGTDFIAMWISSKTHNSAWNYILWMNAIMLLVAGYIFGWTVALYSIIFQFASTQIVSGLHKKYQQVTLFIVTKKEVEIIQEIKDRTNHSVTAIDGVGTYKDEKVKILYTVIGKNHSKQLIDTLKTIDPYCFINVTKTEAVEGNFYFEPME